MTEGRIVRIIDERTLIATFGADVEVTVGTQFVVIQQVEPVADPETNEDLGIWEMVKARLVAAHVQPRLVTLVPVPSGEKRSTVLSERMAWDARGVPIGSEDVTLSIDRSEMSGRRRVEAIKIGDIVRSVG